MLHAWTDFFVTAAGAAASLVGLVIVAISVNLQRILEQPQLPSRGAATVGTLVLILVSSMAELIPQARIALAIEVAVFTILVWGLQFWSARHIVAAYFASRRPLIESMIAILIGQIQVIPFMAGAILLIGHRNTGIYWIAGGVIAAFVCSVLNAWILLVEILR